MIRIILEEGPGGTDLVETRQRVVGKTMEFLYERFFKVVIVGILFSLLAVDACPAVAAVMPTKPTPPEEKEKPLDLRQGPERRAGAENPLEKPDQPDLSELLRRKREKLTICIMLGVVVLLCAYWWTSGKLHHKLPR